MLNTVLLFIADWIIEEGKSEIGEGIKSSFLSKKDTVKWIIPLFYDIFFKTIETYTKSKYIQNYTVELPVLQEILRLQTEDGSQNAAKREILLRIITSYKNKTFTSNENQDLTYFLAENLCEQKIVQNTGIEVVHQTLQNALTDFPINFYDSISEKQGNFLIFQRLISIQEIQLDLYQTLIHQKKTLSNTKLYLMLLVPTLAEIDKLLDNKVDKQKYGETPLDWKPFLQKSLANVLEDIQKRYSIEILPPVQLLTLEQKATFKCQKKNIIIIADSMIFAMENPIYQNIIQEIDDCNLGGIIMPDYTQYQEIEQLKQKNMPYLAFYHHTHQYPFIEWNVASDTDFTKRIQERAKALVGAISINSPQNSGIGTY